LLSSKVVNWALQKASLRTVAALHENSARYVEWKKTHNPDWKPWLEGYDPSEEPYARYIKT